MPKKDHDEIMDDAPMPLLQPRSDSSSSSGMDGLQSAFAWQQEKIKELVQDEFVKHLPPFPAPSTSSSLTKQAATLWSYLQLSSEHRSTTKDEHMLDTILKKNNELQQEIESLRSLNDKLAKEMSSSENEHSFALLKLQRENDSLKVEHDDIRRELAQERLKSSELEAKTDSLRSMLIPTNETQLSDGQVVASFTALRSQILKLVKTAWSREFKTDVKLSEDQNRILGAFQQRKIDMRYLDNRLVGVVFSILKDQIFDVRHYALGEKCSHLTKFLSRAESTMAKHLSNDSDTSMADWRLATMKVTAPFRDGEHCLAREAFCAIEDFFHIFKPRDPKNAADGKKLLEKICSEAVALSLIMRTAKDDYHLNMLSQAMNLPVSEFELSVEDLGFYPAVSDSDKPDTIAYIMAAALVKFPYGNAADAKVLQKAQAAVYMKPKKKA